MKCKWIRHPEASRDRLSHTSAHMSQNFEAPETNAGQQVEVVGVVDSKSKPALSPNRREFMNRPVKLHLPF